MALTATPARRRLVMIALLLLAASGAIIRKVAPNPSTLRDVGTLLLVMWLPAVGNLIAYLIRKLPRRTPAAPDFVANAPFTAHLLVELQGLDAAEGARAGLPTGERRCTILVGQQAFTARLDEPVASAIAAAGTRTIALEFLRPDVALSQLVPAADFHLLVGQTAVARGRVLQAPVPAAQRALAG
jgi:hypothetical protein